MKTRTLIFPPDGPVAAHAFVNVATLTGLTGLDAHVADLIASGNLMVH